MQFIIRENGVDLEVVEISEIDKKVVEHYVGCFKSWICAGPKFFVENKAKARRDALRSVAVQALRDAGKSLLLTEDEMFAAYFALPGYKTMKQAEEEHKEVEIPQRRDR